MRLFISYAHVDIAHVRQLVEILRAGNHDPWFDHSLTVGREWKDQLYEAITRCEAFVYALSPESVDSEWCQWEFDQAVRMGKAIIPVLLQAKTRLPDVLGRYQYADFSEGPTPQGVARLMGGLSGVTVKIAPRELAAAPENPKGVPAQVQTVEVAPDNAPSISVDAAANALDSGDFEKAVYLLKNMKGEGRLGRIIAGMLKEAETGLEAQRRTRRMEAEYRPIVELVRRERTRKMGCAEFQDFRREFPDYDPENLAAGCAEKPSPLTPLPQGEGSGKKPSPSASPISSQTRPAGTSPLPQGEGKKAGSKVYDILPAPFEWIEIPAGKVTLVNDWDNDEKVYLKKNQPQIFDVPAFAIGKYPVTNAQFAAFIKAKGYQQQKWWTEAGWQKREKQKWTEPRLWTDKQWNGVDYPVVGVSWYEAAAFCAWLEAETREEGEPAVRPYRIHLPTEQEWQRAAQGDDGREYPWGNEAPDETRCNFDKNVGHTTPVTQYPLGASPYGVMDMSGNVWEWCVTAYYSGQIGRDGTDARVVRGGSFGGLQRSARAAFRNLDHPADRDLSLGFRVVRRPPSL